MPNIITPRRLREVVETSPDLPFLALTSKIENTFRDKLAYILYQELYKKKKQFKISREWTPKRGSELLQEYYEKISRVDLAVIPLKEGKPTILIEFKAMYSINGLSKPKPEEYPEKVKRDLNKKFGNCPKENSYAVLLATHLKKIPGKSLNKKIEYLKKLEDVIKYVDKGIITQLKKYKSTNKIKKECERNIKKSFKKTEYKTIRPNTLHLGEAYGIEVELLYWIIQRKN